MSERLRFVLTTLRLAATVLGKNPVRSLLTALGILVGVFAVTVVVALGEGASQAISQKMSTLGTATLDIVPEAREKSGVRSPEAPEALTESDAAALVAQAVHVSRAAPMMDSMARVIFRDANASTQVKGTTADFFEISDWQMARGAVWSRRAEVEKDRVCVLGKVVADALFGPENAVGRVIRIGRYPFTVVGVLEEKGSAPGSDMDDSVIMPVGTFRSKMLPALPGQVHRIVAQAKTSEAVGRARREIVGILRQRHGLGEGAPSDFRVTTQRSFQEMQERVLGTLRLLLLGIAAVSLVVGGIGVMNIMLVSVTERTREIGIRMAIGARQWHIQVQFLVEAVVLSLLGGVGGALAAALGVELLGAALELPMEVSLRALGAAVVTSTGIGVFFGFLPARRAARLDPIEALRAEP